MNAEKILDAVAGLDPAILNSISKQRYKRINISKPNTVIAQRIAALAAAAAVSTAAVFIAVPAILKATKPSSVTPDTDTTTKDGVSDNISNNVFDTNEDTNLYSLDQPILSPTLEELYNIPPLDILLPRNIPDGYLLINSKLFLTSECEGYTLKDVIDSNFLFERGVHVEASFSDGENGFLITVEDYKFTTYDIYNGGSNIYRPDDSHLHFVIKAEDLLNEGPELMQKTGSQDILCGNYIVEIYDISYEKGKTFNFEEIYNMITSSLYFQK